MVKRVGVYWNSGKAHGLSVARSVIELAQGSDMEPVLDAALADALGERGGLSVDQTVPYCRRLRRRRGTTCLCWESISATWAS